MGNLKRSSSVSSVPPFASTTKKFPKPFAKSKRFFHKRSKSAPIGKVGSHDGALTETSAGDCDQTALSRATPCLPADNVTIPKVTVNIDDGAPSSSVLKDLNRVLRLIEAERHLVAHDLLLDAKRRLQDTKRKQSLGKEREQPSLKKLDHSRTRYDSSAATHLANGKGPRNTYHVTKNSTPADIVPGKDEDHEHDNMEFSTGSHGASHNCYDEEYAGDFFAEKEEEFKALENRSQMFINAKENLSIDDDWTLSHTLFGITTHYRRETDGSLSIKIEGELHGIPLFEQLVVLRECDLYHTWAPFTQKSLKLAQVGKLDVVAWYIGGIPLLGLTRDACYRAVGCDCMREDGSVLLVAVGLNDSVDHGVKDSLKSSTVQEAKAEQRFDRLAESLMTDPVGESSPQPHQQQQQQQQQQINQELRTRTAVSSLVDTTASSFLTRDAILETIQIPPIPQGMGRGRMTIRNFAASIDILGPSSARTKMVVNVDPNLHLIPQPLVDYCMKKMCGVLLARLQATARKVVKDPIKNPHSRRMREDVRFYRDWLLPKFRLYCDELGWIMPPVGAFSVTEEDLEAEGIFEGWRAEDVFERPIQQYNGEEETISPSLSSNFRSVSVNSSSSSKRKHKTRLGKLGHFIHDHELRTVGKRELKIASARRRAAKRLEPQPFSESKIARLKELKDAKLRSAERFKSNTYSSNDSQTSYPPPVEPDDKNSTRNDTLILFASVIMNLALLQLEPYLNQRAPREPHYSSFYTLIDLIMQDLVVLTTMALQSISLWALLNSVLIFSFDSIDVGQRKIVKNLDYGKKLYAGIVRKYSFVVSCAVFVLSFGIAVAGSIYRRLVVSMCWLLNNGLHQTHFDWRQAMSLKMSTHLLFPLRALLRSAGMSEQAFVAASKWLKYFLLQQLTRLVPLLSVTQLLNTILSWSANTLAGFMPNPADKTAINMSALYTSGVSKMIRGLGDFCDAGRVDQVPWRQTALSISVFATTRVGVFVLALVLMSHLFLNKSERETLNQSAILVQDETKKRHSHSCRETSVPDYVGSDGGSPMRPTSSMVTITE